MLMPRRVLMIGILASASALVAVNCRRNTLDLTRGAVAQPSAKQDAANAASVPAGSAAVQDGAGAAASPPVCPRFGKGQQIGRIKHEDLKEASGLAVSRKNPGVIWSHNDTSRRPRLFAMLLDGTNLGTYTLDDVEPVDWEDIGIAKSADGQDWELYVADIGNNDASRTEITLYRVKEPNVKPDQKPKNRRLRDVERFSFVYPKHDSHNAETLLVDPKTRDVYLITKSHSEPSTLYRAKAPLVTGRTMTLEQLTSPDSLNGASRRGALVTGGDVSDDGMMVLVRTYKDAYLWLRQGSEPLSSTIERPACPIPLRREEQGEAIAFAPDGSGYFTLSEGQHSRVFQYERLKDE